MRCEVCGRKIHTEPVTAIIEGAKLTVCIECSKHGRIIHQEETTMPNAAPNYPSNTTKKPQGPATTVQKKPSTPSVQITQEITPDYANQIRMAREKLSLTHEELGKKIMEKASLLKHIEAKKMEPNNQLAQKLERTLKIKLLIPISQEKISQFPKSANKELTLGDLVKIDKQDEAVTERKQS